VSRGADELLAEARRRIRRVGPERLDSVWAEGGIVVDIRPAGQRAAEGELDGSIIVERNALEWRLDPNGTHRIPEVRDYGQQVIVVCSEGYASSLAAASLVDLGFTRAGDLIGGYVAWRIWSTRKVVRL
jgi:rhodanese-related sulfurtransferase